MYGFKGKEKMCADSRGMRKVVWIQLGRAKCVDPWGKKKGVWIQVEKEKVCGAKWKKEKV